MQSFSRSLNLMRQSSAAGITPGSRVDQGTQTDPEEPLYEDLSSAYECSICLETAREPVNSLCGHLFCWPCLHQWLYASDNSTQEHKTCPVCRSAISRERVIPIYLRKGDGRDPRDKLPPRPPGQREEVDANPQFPYGHVWPFDAPAHIFSIVDGGLQMTFAIGTLPHFVMTTVYSYMMNNDGRMSDTEFYFMRFFAICGILCLLCAVFFC